MNALSTITIMPETKGEIEMFKSKVIDELKSGNYCPLDIAIRFKAMENLIKEIQADKDFKELTTNEAAKHGKLAEIRGCKIETAEMGVKYDFSGCGDSELEQLESKLKLITEQKNARENWLKSFKDVAINEETGEIINPPVKSSTTGIKITLAK